MSQLILAKDLERQVLLATVSDRYDIALAGAAEASASAPRLTGAYSGGMGARRYGSGAVVMVDTDPDSAYKEFGTIDTPAHAELTNAARRRGRYTGR